MLRQIIALVLIYVSKSTSWHKVNHGIILKCPGGESHIDGKVKV